ncbi:DUF982 domain-containing protein [Phyllobacterium sp. K27]
MESEFSKPVIVKSRSGRPRAISSAAEAHQFLLSEWKGRRKGATCARAKITCSGTVDGSFSTREARKAFIDAAVEADILLE